MEVTSQSWQIGPVGMELEIWPGRVFVPTKTSELMAKTVEVHLGETVVDLGCGSGFFSVLAAKMGAERVVAIDIMEDACRLTRHNAERNGVGDRVLVVCSDLFSGLGKLEADVVINDVSGIAEPVARRSEWYPEPIPTGGPDGTEPTVKMLEAVRNFLRPLGRLYFPVLSLARDSRIIETAQKVFGELRLKESIWFPLSSKLAASLADLQQLVQDQIIRLSRRGSRYLWQLQIFEAQNRIRS